MPPVRVEVNAERLLRPGLLLHDKGIQCLGQALLIMSLCILRDSKSKEKTALAVKYSSKLALSFSRL